MLYRIEFELKLVSIRNLLVNTHNVQSATQLFVEIQMSLIDSLSKRLISGNFTNGGSFP